MTRSAQKYLAASILFRPFLNCKEADDPKLIEALRKNILQPLFSLGLS
jgi:hypothetical protein